MYNHVYYDVPRHILMLLRTLTIYMLMQFVIFGGHIDNWDVGTGAVDDGSGVCIAWQVCDAVVL